MSDVQKEGQAGQRTIADVHNALQDSAIAAHSGLAKGVAFLHSVELRQPTAAFSARTEGPKLGSGRSLSAGPGRWARTAYAVWPMIWQPAARGLKALYEWQSARAFCLYVGVVTPTHLAWEVLQLPLYTIWDAPARERIVAIAHCTVGDVMISAISLALALVAAGRRNWPTVRFWPVALLTLVAGLVYTAFSEWLNVSVRGSWEYSSAMPLIPMFGFDLGASPVLQWVMVPAVGWAALLRWRKTRGRPTPL